MPSRGFSICSSCYAKRYVAEQREKTKERAEDMYMFWLSLIKNVKQPYTMLTEEQWIDACKHFGKCAICGDYEIATRFFFITYADGGRYTAWNVLPICEACNRVRGKSNPFLFYDKQLNHRFANTPNCIAPIINYLLPKLEEAIYGENRPV
jgi:5-methylcytosine-specific restriction endonuclease McrA